MRWVEVTTQAQLDALKPGEGAIVRSGHFTACGSSDLAELDAQREAAEADWYESGGYWESVMACGRALRPQPLVFDDRPGMDPRLFGADDDPDLRPRDTSDAPEGGWPW